MEQNTENQVVKATENLRTEFKAKITAIQENIKRLSPISHTDKVIENQEAVRAVEIRGRVTIVTIVNTVVPCMTQMISHVQRNNL